MSIEVLVPGACTTVQDLGRHGWRHLGVGQAGALDAWAHRIGNLLVGNPASAATLEIALTGPTLRFVRPARIALTGAQIEARVDGLSLPCWSVVDLPAGSVLRLGRCSDGARSHLAIRGGFDLPPVLGSRATDLRGGFGGLDGRALRTGDRLPADAGGTGRLRVAPWWIDAHADLDDALPDPAGVRVLPGEDALAEPTALAATQWRVSASSDRQGLRLDGPPLALAAQVERISAPVFPGTVQLPPDGRPIVLLADAQTHGGYPVIGHVARADLSRLAQRRPGAPLRLVPCTRQEAAAAACVQRHRLARIGEAVAARLRLAPFAALRAGTAPTREHP
ncbi:biotin-dependent carboxyltransferase family protein [Coralloluteibacterium thermophilus]|uniref:Biotin-dependent carboxyltransferase family protein n=1 Tax=Coralloluteibacterium thermophilum TaxID=2707049 RepID=A0ABV9NIP6_9GAMM